MMSDQAFALARHGHEVIVITARQTYANPKDRLLAHARIPGVTVHRVWASSFGRARLVRIGDGVLRKLRDASLRAAHKNVVLGAVMQRDVERLKVPASRIVQFPNWANGEAIKPIARAQNAHRADWDLDDAFGIAHAGNLVRAHDA